MIRACILILLAALGTLPAARAENTLRWVTTLAPGGFDPDAFEDPQTLSVLNQVYEGLVCYGFDFGAEPCLATSWKLVDPLTWEFQLREGVRFHDGTPFTSEDVVFSVERARAEGSVNKDILGNVAQVAATGSPLGPPRHQQARSACLGQGWRRGQHHVQSLGPTHTALGSRPALRGFAPPSP